VTTALDTLLDDIAMPTSSRSFDVAAGLRRLAADAALGGPTPEVERASRAAQRLSIVCRWMLNTTDAPLRLQQLADTTADTENADDGNRAGHRDGGTGADREQVLTATFDIRGAAVFACVLYLGEQPESAQFWWQLAAGAGSRMAAYCLHLHHRALGETREAQHWYRQVLEAIRDAADHDEATTAENTGYLHVLDAMTCYVRRNSASAVFPVSDRKSLKAEVDRLASRTPSGLVNGPDQQLAARLAAFTAQC
jgi:hypothetical protein